MVRYELYKKTNFKIYRKIMKKTYFLHQSNSFYDYKIIRMRSKLGIEAYGIFWAVLELLFTEENKLCIQDYEPLAFNLQCDKDKLKSVVEDFDLFVIEENCFYSKRLNNHLEEINTKSSKAKENASKRWNNATAMQTQSDRNASISISSNKSISKSKNKNNINERMVAFKNAINSIKDIDKDDKENFYDYWSELNKSGSKQRWELEKTWDLNRRMKRWANSGFNKKDKEKFPDYWDVNFSRKLPDENKRTEYYNHLKSIGWVSTYSPSAGMVWNKKK